MNTLSPALINAYSQASRAWHAFFGLKSDGGKRVAVAVAVTGAGEGKSKHGREASQQLQPALVKRERGSQGRKEDDPTPGSPGTREAMAAALAKRRAEKGLQLIYGPDAQPQSRGQAAALKLVHRAMDPDATTIIVLPTGSGKTALFFSVAALAVQQTVIVVVPFAALIDDIVARGSGSGLSCEEWQGPGSIALMPQLLVVSADRAVGSEFLHFAKGLEREGQLAHLFFDECHVAITDTSYRQRLRQLHQLRHCRCPLTCLTATLLVKLEPVLRANLLLPDATLFRRSTMRPTIRYTVLTTSPETMPSEFAAGFIPTLPLPPGQRGVVYVRSYATGEVISTALQCPFYKAHADQKAAILDQWARGSGGWIVATGALGTGVNISNIVHIVHVDRPYGLTSFIQQSGRGGRSGEESHSYVIVRGGSGGRRRPALVTAYTVEDEDEAALSEFLEATSCRRAILARHMDGVSEGADCTSSSSMLCDWCEGRKGDGGLGIGAGGRGTGSSSGSGSQVIAQAYRQDVQQDEAMVRFLDELKRHCIFCQLIRLDGDAETGVHSHAECPEAESYGCGIEAYRQWRRQLELAQRGQCFRCGLPQSICTAVEQGERCTYYHILLPGIFILHQYGELEDMCTVVGFQGEYGAEGWQWQWLKQESPGRFGEGVLNYMRVWEEVRRQYCIIKEGE